MIVAGDRTRSGVAAWWFAACAMAIAAASACKRSEEPPPNVMHPFPERFVGVGLELRIQERFPRVVRVIPGSAAAHARVEVGDSLVAIDDAPTAGWSLADTVAALRGEAGTRVSLTLLRGPDQQKHVVGLRRRAIARSGASDGQLSGAGYRGKN